MTRITDFDWPRLFVDESNEGPFATFGMSTASSLTMTPTMRDIVDFRVSFDLSAGWPTYWWPLRTYADFCDFVID